MSDTLLISKWALARRNELVDIPDKLEIHPDLWHCGCCGAPFRIHPTAEDIPHYIKLMELGGKK